MEKSLIVIEHGRCTLFDCPFVTLCTMQTNKTKSKKTTHSHAYKEQQHPSRKHFNRETDRKSKVKVK